MPWPTSNHESPDVDLAIPPVVAPHYLWSFLTADGQTFRANEYRLVRDQLGTAIELFGQGNTAGQRPRVDISDSRWRTWKKAFESMGLLSVVDDKIEATRFGRAVLEGWARVDESLRGANSRIALLGAEVANRVLLAPPGAVPVTVPENADLHPLRAIWAAFRALDDRLHWEDVNRVLGHVHFEADLPAAIQAIQDYRTKHAGSYASSLLADLGPNPLSTDARHITPWLNRASLGGLLFPSEPDQTGFRVMPVAGRNIVDNLLAQTPPALPSGAGPSDYMRYLMEPVEVATSPIDEADASAVDGLLDAVAAFGGSKIVVLSGLPGTGKTRLAKLAADRLVDGDPSRLLEIQFHESVSYEDFVEGFVPRRDGSGFSLKPKALRTINDRAIANPTQQHVLLIEEFTRANTHSVLGELLTYVEHRDRPFHWSISQDPGVIAPNLAIIATMNPRDRSALQLDAALRRRMHVIPVPPSLAGLEVIVAGLPDQERADLLAWFKAHMSDLPFGHGLFAGAKDPDLVRAIWRGTVSTMLVDFDGTVAPEYRKAFDEFPLR